MNDEFFRELCLPGAAHGPNFSTATTGPAVTSNELLRRMAEMLENVKPEPLGEWMREQGYPPEQSTLYLPRTAEWITRIGPFAPIYVQFTTAVAAPALARNETLPGAQR